MTMESAYSYCATQSDSVLLIPGIQGEVYITWHGTAVMEPQRKQ